MRYQYEPLSHPFSILTTKNWKMMLSSTYLVATMSKRYKIKKKIIQTIPRTTQAYGHESESGHFSILWLPLVTVEFYFRIIQGPNAVIFCYISHASCAIWMRWSTTCALLFRTHRRHDDTTKVGTAVIGPVTSDSFELRIKLHSGRTVKI